MTTQNALAGCNVAIIREAIDFSQRWYKKVGKESVWAEPQFADLTIRANAAIQRCTATIYESKVLEGRNYSDLSRKSYLRTITKELRVDVSQDSHLC